MFSPLDFFFLKLFFLFDSTFSNFWTKHNTLETKKNPSLTKVLRKGSTLWAGLGWVWGGRDEMRLEFFGVAVLLYTLENEHLEPQKRSWRFGRKMKTAGFQRGDFMFQTPFFSSRVYGIEMY